MSDGNKKLDWQVFESLYYRLLSHYKHVLKQYHNTHIIKEIKGKFVKLVDSTTVSLCLAMFDWVEFRTTKGGIKLPTSWDYNLMILEVVNITEAKVHDRYGLEQLIYPKDTINVKDRGCFDFNLMLNRVRAENVFVTRITTNTVYDTIVKLTANIDFISVFIEFQRSVKIVLVLGEITKLTGGQNSVGITSSFATGLCFRSE